MLDFSKQWTLIITNKQKFKKLFTYYYYFVSDSVITKTFDSEID